MTISTVLGCASAPEGVTPVGGFDVQRYLGVWHEIARLDHRFERGLSNVTATYSLRPDGAVEVHNRGYDDRHGTWKEVRGKAVFTGARDVGQLSVTFFWPFSGAYNVIALDAEGYQWALVAGPSREYFWILSRTPVMEAALRERLVAQAAAMGFATDKLIFVAQDRAAR
jgi:apolipoprotein D and lipocalin family protein